MPTVRRWAVYRSRFGPSATAPAASSAQKLTMQCRAIKVDTRAEATLIVEPINLPTPWKPSKDPRLRLDHTLATSFPLNLIHNQLFSGIVTFDSAHLSPKSSSSPCCPRLRCPLPCSPVVSPFVPVSVSPFQFNVMTRHSPRLPGLGISDPHGRPPLQTAPRPTPVALFSGIVPVHVVGEHSVSPFYWSLRERNSCALRVAGFSLVGTP